MAEKLRPAWSGWVWRYLSGPRHGRDEDSRSVSRLATAVVAAVVLGLGVATYAGLHNTAEEPAAGVAAPAVSPVAPDDDGPSAVVAVIPAPYLTISASATSPSPATKPAAPSAAKSKPAPAATPRPPAARTKKPVWQQRTITATSVLTTGQSWSTDRLSLTVTGGGDLVLKDQGRTVWGTGTTTGVKLVMQDDGHLVLYDARNGTAWSSGTAGNPGAVLVLRADGDLVISLNGRTLFRTGTGD
jgi:hypothetical protein